MFNDDDAEGVKDLDDLGGGRLYDNTTAGVSQSALVGNMTMSILNGHRAQYVLLKSFLITNDTDYSRPGPRKKKKKTATSTTLQQQLHMVVLKQQGTPAQNGTTKRPVSFPTARSNPKAISLAKPANISRRENISNLIISESSKESVDLNAPLPFKIANMVCRVGVRFSSRDIDPAMAADVVLSAAKRPDMGFFQVIFCSRTHCCWPIATWDDYFTGADNLLSVTFRNGHSIHGYQLYFDAWAELVRFVNTVKDLQNGDYLHTVDIPALAAPDPIPAVAPVGAASSHFTEISAVHAEINVRAAETSTLGSAETILEPFEAPARGVAKGFPGVDTSLLDSPIPADEFDRMSQATHEVDGERVAPLFPKCDLLSLVGADHTTDKTSGGHAIQSFRDAVVNTARTVFQFFCYSGAGGNTVTEHEFRETAAGVKSGVLQYMIQEAKQGGLGEEELETLEDAINEVLRSKVRSRLVYSVEDLLSLRSNATKPPGCLADIPYLPKPAKRQVSASSTANSLHRQNAADRQATASSNNMKRALGKSGSDGDKANTSESGFADSQNHEWETSSFDASTPKVKGLRGSRWASDTADVKHPEYFTGAKYEKAKRSYLNDLAQLTPGARVTTGTEDLMDFYFPRPEEENPHVDPVEPQTPLSNDQGSTVALSASGKHTGTEISTPSKADNMETLRVEMSRLSIWSPAVSGSENSGAVAPVRPSGSTPSSHALLELCSQPASTEPTKPDGVSTVSTVKKTPRPTQMLYAPPASRAGRLADTTTTSTAAPLEALQPLMAQPTAAEHSQSLPPQVAPQAAPKMRGLAASRHSSGVAPSSSGNFNFRLPRSSRK